MSEAGTVPAAVMSRADIRQRLGNEVPNPEPGYRYFWAAANAAHPQSYVRYKLEGWEVVPAADAEKVGLAYFVDPITGAEVGPNSSNCIFNGDSVLMRTRTENYARIVREKQDEFRKFDPDSDGKTHIDRKAEADIENVHKEYRDRRGRHG